MVFVVLYPNMNFCVGDIKHIKTTENKLDLECYTISFILNLVPVPAAQIVHPGQCPPFTAVCEETSTVTPDFVFKVIAKNSLIKNIFVEEKTFDSRT